MNKAAHVSGSDGALGIVVGGGPSPGVNGIIRAITFGAWRYGVTVVGIEDGFYWLGSGETSHARQMTPETVDPITLSPGVELGTSRYNPTGSPEAMKNVLASLQKLNIRYLAVIGGDDTGRTAALLQEMAGDQISIALIPKTIDNDLPVPGDRPSFGYQTAHEEAVGLIRSIYEDARTTQRWFFLTVMGAKTGHLALGVGKATEATLTLIPEAFREEVNLDTLARILEAAIIRNRIQTPRRNYGVAILAEGLYFKLPKEDRQRLAEWWKIEEDPNGLPRISQIDFGRVLKDIIKERYWQRALETDSTLDRKKWKFPVVITSLNIGYEIRSRVPNAFDCEYALDLGHAAVDGLLRNGIRGVILGISGGHAVFRPFSEIIDAESGRIVIQHVNVQTPAYRIARDYMLRLNPGDLQDEPLVTKMAEALGISSERLRAEYQPALDAELI